MAPTKLTSLRIDDLTRRLLGKPYMTFTDSIFAAIADGFRLRMLRHEKSVPLYFTKTVQYAAVANYYAKFKEAVAYDAGLSNFDNEIPRFHFSRIPEGGAWEAAEISGYGVLPLSAEFTPDGVEFAAEADSNDVANFPSHHLPPGGKITRK